ncbi:MAG TPA: diguanylate cyclase [Kineosporiaceae bacterium]|nr:diguanylate cyclase [Kineosporiaceae bacterium]
MTVVGASRELIEAARTGQATPSRVSMRRLLEELDRSTFANPRVDLEFVEAAEKISAREGWPELQMRAELLRADRALADGDVTLAAQLGRRVSTWAREHRDLFLQSRSHYLLASVFRATGDFAESLAQSVRAVAATPADAPAWMRAGHICVLAIGLILTKSVGPARRRFEEALALAQTSGDRQIELMVLNNLTYGMYDIGDQESARTYAQQLRALGRDGGVVLKGHHLDTLARIEMAAGHYQEAEALLEPAVADPSGLLHSDADSYPASLLTYAESQRLRGAVGDAQQTLDRAAAVIEERRLEHLAALLMQEQARLYADQGRYREAYEELTVFQAAWIRLQDSQREVRACVAHAMYEAEETRRDRDQFRELATRDPLTGLHNRRLLDERLPVLIGAAERSGTPFAVALLDLDHFKRVNDTCSHEAGDLVLTQVATLTRAEVPASASVVRMGGEEFLVIFPDCGPDLASVHAERIRLAVQDHDWSGVTGGLPVTVSVGVTTCTGATTVGALLARADRHLYAAKQSGRNRVVDDITHSPPPPSPASGERRRHRGARAGRPAPDRDR